MTRLFAIIALLGLSFATMAPHLLLGVPLFALNSGHDAMFHFEILAWLGEEPWRGPLPPIWFFNASTGLGAPPAVFYGVGAYLPALLFQALGLDADRALSLTLALARAAGVLGVAVWARRRGAGWDGAVVAAAIYTLLPSTLLNSAFIGVRYPETVAIGLLPWVLLLADRAGRGVAYLLPVALGFGLLAITHLQTTLLAALVLPAWVLATRGRAASGWLMLGGAFGACLAAWLLLPALTLRGLINEGGWNAATRMAELVLFGPWLFEGWAEQPQSWPFWATLYAAWAIGTGLGLAGLGLAGMGAAGPAVPPPAGARMAAAFALMLGLSMVPPLAWAWPHVPLLVNVQFPWRHLPLLGLFAGLSAAGLCAAGAWPRRGIAALVLVMAAGLALPWAERLLPPPVFAAHQALLLHFPADRAAAAAERAAADYTPPEYLPAGAMASGFDWDGQDARRAALATICAEQPCAVLDRSRPGQLRLALPPAGGILLPHFFWPGLVCTGCDLALDARTGLIRATPRPGAAAEAVVRVAALPAQWAGIALSAAALALWGSLALWRLRRR